jgi:cytochrome c biogenesis protein CcdA/thiol-disulfide isomerase/thioredoxin
MVLILAAYLGGVLTILSPCILPVLPFVFARSDQSFGRTGLPLLVGMALTFAVVATFAAVGGGWVVQANHLGRVAAIILLAAFGLTLLLPSLADRLTRPLVALGSRLSQSAAKNGAKPSVWTSLLVGAATGLLWAPCAGPILGLLLTGAALKGASIGTSLLLLAYALGAATSLGVAVLVGGRIFTAMKRSLGAGEWIRRGLGVAVLAGVAVISLGLDTGFLTRVSLASTNGIEQSLLDILRGKPGRPQEAAMTMRAAPSMMMAAANQANALPVEGEIPSLSGAVAWLNTPPLTRASLKGHVVLVDFWTYSCINCLRALPYVEAWANKYHDQGLIVIGVHAPEFAFERNIDNVKRAISKLGITYPVAIDNNYAIWQGFGNEYWPAHYFIDAEGRIRHHHFGEGNYRGSERVIQQLLREAGGKDVPNTIVSVNGTGAEAAADEEDIGSPETYIGIERAMNCVSPGGEIAGRVHTYVVPADLALNEWGLSGDWQVGSQDAVVAAPGAGISFRFHARDLHLVLGPSADGHSVRFRIMIDGKPPGADHGADTDAAGDGTITGQRLYQLVRQHEAVADRTFEIQFLDPGASAYSFTFG